MRKEIEEKKDTDFKKRRQMGLNKKPKKGSGNRRRERTKRR